MCEDFLQAVRREGLMTYLPFVVVGNSSEETMHNNRVSNMINSHHAFCRHDDHARLKFSLGDLQQFVQHLLQHSGVRFCGIDPTVVCTF